MARILLECEFQADPPQKRAIKISLAQRPGESAEELVGRVREAFIEQMLRILRRVAIDRPRRSAARSRP